MSDSVFEIFWDTVFMVSKKWTILMFGRYLKKTKGFLNAISQHIVVSIFLKTLVKDHKDSFS